MLREDPDWKEYCIRCEELDEKPSLIGFNRWFTSTVNAETVHHYDPEEELKKRIAENKELLNVVCR